MPELACPVCHRSLTGVAKTSCSACEIDFPLVDGIPVLLNESNSVFRLSDYVQGQGYEGASSYDGSLDRTSGWRRAYRKLARHLAEAPIPGPHFDPREMILKEKPDAEILVLGAGEHALGYGRVTYTDVAMARNITCICDGHDLPFEDAVFDVVFAQAVLEHVCDPQRVVAEITRVLKPDGLVYAVTPFLQPVHMGAYDFTRFTYLGHRRLFRQFDDVQSGMCGGPGYAAVHLTRNLLTALTDRHRVRSMLRLAGLLLTYPLRYLDPYLSRTEGAYNAACACYFLGRKRSTTIPDREILAMFRGR